MTDPIETPGSPTRRRLQALLLSDDAREKALYWRKVDALGNPIDSPGGGFIDPGSILRLDTFLNSFYERYWRDLTGLRSLELCVETSGPCRIRILRRSARLREALVAEARAVGNRARSVLVIDFDILPAADTVLHVEIEALDEPVVLYSGAWETATPARNDVRLAVVTCSFGRESMLIENLRRVAEVVGETVSIVEFLVVQQGTLQLSGIEPFVALASDAALARKLRVVQQRNFGGTGGFTRGLLEVLRSSATHVLLLDDDIRLEPWVLERLLALLAHLAAPATIGGQMLDLLRPSILHAAHEEAHLEALELRNPYASVDLAHAHMAALFGRRQLSGYNAWWFCCIAIDTIKQIGLPVPMFIRHDDVEHGVRSVAAGVPVVTMPGLFVWHEPFTKKAKALTVYYEHRNFLVAAALHGRMRRLRFARLHWQNAWGALRRHRFEYCWARCRAVEDFLAGPALIFVDLPGRHRDLTAAQARVTLMTMASVRYHSDPQRRRRMRRRLSPTRLLLFGPRGLTTAETAFATTIRALFLAIIRSSLTLLWSSGRAERAYRAEAAIVTSPAYWRHLLGLTSEDS